MDNGYEGRGNGVAAGGDGAEGARRASVEPSPPAARAGERPDPEVPAKAARRRYTSEYKKRILEEADRCTEPGDLGALLRREGLYSSLLSNWRQQREELLSRGLSRKRGRKSRKNPLEGRVSQLERENARLRDELDKARTIIAVQKKVARLLGESDPDEGKS